MKNRFQQLDIKKTAILALIIGLIFINFFLAEKTRAAVVLEQLDNSFFEERTTFIRQTLGAGLSGDVREIIIQYENRYDFDCHIYNPEATTDPYSVIQLSDDAGKGVSYFAAKEKLPNNQCLFWRVERFAGPFTDTPYSLNPNINYDIGINQNGPYLTHKFYGSNNPDSYPNGKAQYLSGSTWVDFTTVKDLYFKMGVDIEEPEYTFEFNEPKDGQALPTDFGRWFFDVKVPEDGLYSIQVFYQREEISGNFLSDRLSPVNLIAGQDYLIGVYKSVILGIGNWQATAWLEKYNPENQLYEAIVSTVRSINFSISGILLPEEPESGEPLDLSVCYDEQYGWIERALCIVNIKVFKALFIPTSESVNRFNLIWPAIEKKPPVGYFTAIKDGLDTLTEQSPAFSFNLPEELKNTLFNPIRTGTAAVLWLFFGVWGIKRLSRLEL